MKKVAIKLDGTKEQFVKAQGYLLFLGAVGPYTQMPNDLEYILIDQFGTIGATNTEIIPDDYYVIDPFSEPKLWGGLKANDDKTFPREMMVWDIEEKYANKLLIDGMYKGMYVTICKDGSFMLRRYAKEIDYQPTELDQLKAENEMLKDKINRLKNLVNNEM